MAVLPPSAGFAARNGAHLFTINLTPSVARPVQHVCVHRICPPGARWLPEGHVRRHGRRGHCRLAGSRGRRGWQLELAASQSAAPAAPPAVVRIEEHFGSGWDNWVGGMKDWLVDVAGVRTGSLALFVPDLGTDRLRFGFSRANRYAQPHLGGARGRGGRIPALHAYRGRRRRARVQPLRRDRGRGATAGDRPHSACPENRAPR